MKKASAAARHSLFKEWRTPFWKKSAASVCGLSALAGSRSIRNGGVVGCAKFVVRLGIAIGFGHSFSTILVADGQNGAGSVR